MPINSGVQSVHYQMPIVLCYTANAVFDEPAQAPVTHSLQAQHLLPTQILLSLNIIQTLI